MGGGDAHLLYPTYTPLINSIHDHNNCYGGGIAYQIWIEKTFKDIVFHHQFSVLIILHPLTWYKTYYKFKNNILNYLIVGVCLMSDNYLEKDFERVNKKFKELMNEGEIESIEKKIEDLKEKSQSNSIDQIWIEIYNDVLDLKKRKQNEI